ncbi:uncharacterized protein LOC121399012 isoform X2 [Xenopus laevis]|uniref:Uncharacterized protein LOC121399012 isoform X2 n=1 Tax=Xenopus laevis TaxID=8355 RepID=A0A8J1LZ48_XENLA|nr:uncharacterized protein LOC121399012 isoform X2 [Xenopus laevis]
MPADKLEAALSNKAEPFLCTQCKDTVTHSGSNTPNRGTTGNRFINALMGAKCIVIQPLRSEDSGHMDADQLQEEISKGTERLHLAEDNKQLLPCENYKLEESVKTTTDPHPNLNQSLASLNRSRIICRSDPSHQETTENQGFANDKATGIQGAGSPELQREDSAEVDTDQLRDELRNETKSLNGGKTDGLSNPQAMDTGNIDTVTISGSDTSHIGTTRNLSAIKPAMGDALMGQTPGHNVTVLYWDTPRDLEFLHAKIKEHWPMNIKSIKFIPLCIATEDEWKCTASEATYIVLYHSMQLGKFIEDGKSYLDFCMGTHEFSNILVIVTDLEDSLRKKEMRRNWDQSPYKVCHLQLFTEEEMDPFRTSTTKECRYTEEMAAESELDCIQITRHHRIGIFSRSAESDYQWLLTLLESEFRDVVDEVRPYYISNNGHRQFWEDVSHCSVAILYHTMNRGRLNITDVTDSLYDEELKHMSAILEKENVFVVADDLTDSSSTEKHRILEQQHSIVKYACDLVLITQADKEGNGGLKKMLKRIKQKIKTATKRKMGRDGNTKDKKKKCPEQDTVAQAQGSPKPEKLILQRTGSFAVPGPNEVEPKTEEGKLSIKKNHKIGIFSRSAESDYDWLQTSLRTELRDLVVDVRPYYISNNGRLQFWEEVSQCTFGILYHTMRRGRLNITNVADSLYDDELKYMAEQLGKENVIVVADDLEDSSPEKQQRILEHQPNIGEYACDLVLLTPADKKEKAQLMEKLKTIRSALHVTSLYVHLTEEEGDDDQIKKTTEEFTRLVNNLPKPLRKTMKEIMERLDCATSGLLKACFNQAKGRTVNLIQLFKNFCLQQNKIHDRAEAPCTGNKTTHLPTVTEGQPRGHGSDAGTQCQKQPSGQNSQRAGVFDLKPSWPSSWNLFGSANQTASRAKKKHKVGIFSRSVEDDYRWLRRFITSEFSDYVQEVRPCYIYNNGLMQFWEDVSHCSVAILYHTKNRGRINITDVEDSLYDEELQYLANELGKDKVMVVVDDLDEIGPKEKERILERQGSIEKWACDLILVSSSEKDFSESRNSMFKQGLKDTFSRIMQI